MTNIVSDDLGFEPSEIKLSEREEAVCEYLSSHALDVIHMSITEVAEQCKISEASLVRLSKKLGYKGFQALKISMAQNLVKPTHQFCENVTEDDNTQSIVQKMFKSYNETLRDTLDVLNFRDLELSAKMIAGASRLVFIAAGGSNNVAKDAANKFLRIGIPVYTPEDYNTQRMLASVLTPEDVVIAISHSGTTISTIDAVKIAKNVGVQCIAITNFGKSPLLRICDVTLFTSSRETLYRSEAFSSRIAQLVVMDALITLIAHGDESKYYNNLTKTRRALDETKL